MEKIASFKDLKIWQLGMDIVADVYDLTRKFPREEIYGLTNQIRRAAVSIPANIAEGFRRYSSKEHRHFLSIVMGSAAEVETELMIAKRLRFAHETEADDLLKKLDSLGRMLTVVMKRFR